MEDILNFDYVRTVDNLCTCFESELEKAKSEEAKDLLKEMMQLIHEITMTDIMLTYGYVDGATAFSNFKIFYEWYKLTLVKSAHVIGLECMNKFNMCRILYNDYKSRFNRIPAVEIFLAMPSPYDEYPGQPGFKEEWHPVAKSETLFESWLRCRIFRAEILKIFDEAEFQSLFECNRRDQKYHREE